MKGTKRLTRALAIKKHCSDCAGDTKKEVICCELTDCPLWPYRLGDSLNSKSYLRRAGKYGVSSDLSSKTTDNVKKVPPNGAQDD